MARSRLEKIGTIYSRTNSIIHSGAMTWEDRPIWYDVYEAFPPKDEPRYDRPTPNMKLKKIFYEEDKVRAQFHKTHKQIGATNMFNTKRSLTQRFIENYKKLQVQYNGKVNSEQLFQEALDLLRKGKESTEDDITDTVSLSSSFQEAFLKQSSTNEHVKINISNIFKE